MQMNMNSAVQCALTSFYRPPFCFSPFQAKHDESKAREIVTKLKGKTVYPGNKLCVYSLNYHHTCPGAKSPQGEGSHRIQPGH